MEFIYQPADTNRLGEFLIEGFTGPWVHFRAAIAFVKSSGTRHIEDALAAFARERDVEIIAGIDHGGTSYEGLQSLLAAVSPRGKLIVFHNPGFLTFHPKVFLFKSPTNADLYVGSGNLTGGGLFGNYETGMRIRLDLGEPGETEILQQVENVLDDWSDASHGTALALDQQLLDDLAALGLVSRESVIDASHRDDQDDAQAGDGSQQMVFPFRARSEPRAPRVPDRRQGSIADGWGDTAPSKGFVMTLQQTDVGVGQTSPGTSQRSPEIFVPLAARNADTAFWRWPDEFVEDSTRQGKFDRRGVGMRLGGAVIEVNMMTWPDRRDFRLRSEALRQRGCHRRHPSHGKGRKSCR